MELIHELNNENPHIVNTDETKKSVKPISKITEIPNPEVKTESSTKVCFSQATISLAHIKKSVILSARGVKFEVMIASLSRVPNSRLAEIGEIMQKQQKEQKDLVKMKELCDWYSEDFKEIYFDKDASFLSAILKFYESGVKGVRKTHLVSLNCCAFDLEADFEYWKIDYQDYLDSCCLRKFSSNLSSLRKDKETEKRVIEDLNFKENFGKRLFPKIRETIWMIMEKPDSSIWAKVYLVFSSTVIMMSILEIILQSIPSLDVIYGDKSPFNTNGRINPFNLMEAIFVIYFTIELIIRFIVWPHPLKFFIQPHNIFDMISVIPYYFWIIFYTNSVMDKVKVICRIFRVLGLIKVLRTWDGFNMMLLTFRQSVREIAMFLVYLSVNILFFSIIVFYVEKDEPQTTFYSIPAAFWYSLATSTSVGYGDMVPTSIAGKIFGGLCACCGVIIIAIPISLLANNFAATYQHVLLKKQISNNYNIELKKANKQNDGRPLPNSKFNI